MSGKVLLAMSGGIDSSAAAVILLKRGFEVTGLTFRIDGVSSEAVERAEGICERLGIEHIYKNITVPFNEKVIEYFKNEYENGRTPNPCIRCNRDIKFGLIYDFAMENGFDFAATGHYASILCKDNRFFLAKAKDKSRDQTYFLYILTEDKLRHILFPLNGVPKSEARLICSNAGLLPADSGESREICFIPGSYKDFLMLNPEVRSINGNFINKDGIVLSKHDGIINYTVGQRKGLKLNLGKPGYIISINSLNGDITIGDEKDLYSNKIFITDINLINGHIPKSSNLYVKIRYSASQAKIRDYCLEKGNLTITAIDGLRAVTPGQSAVIYDGDTVVGGGTII